MLLLWIRSNETKINVEYPLHFGKWKEKNGTTVQSVGKLQGKSFNKSERERGKEKERKMKRRRENRNV